MERNIPVYCQFENAEVGHLKCEPGQYHITASRFISMFVPNDEGHRLERTKQKDGHPAFCSCGGILALKADSVKIRSLPHKDKDWAGEKRTREQARNWALKEAGAVDRHIENRAGDFTSINLATFGIEVS